MGQVEAAPTAAPSQPQTATDPAALSDWVAGRATFYGEDYDKVDGSCGFGYLNRANWPHWNAMAFSPQNSFRSAGPQQACGMCFEIQCTATPPYQDKCGPSPDTTSVVATVTDICPECEENHVDMQANMFAMLAPPRSGIISIRYRQVMCTPPGGIRVMATAFNGPERYLRLTFQNVAGSAMIQSVRMRGAGDSRLVYNGGSRKQRGLLRVAGSSGDPDGAAGTAFGGQAAINQYGAAWSVNSAPAFPIDLFLVSNTGTVTLLGAIPSLAMGAKGVSFQTSQQLPN